jgi:hypothetical protein
VNDVVLVGVRQRFSQLQAIVEYEISGDWAISQLPAKWLSGNQLHDEECAAFGFADLVDGADIRVIQLRGGAGFSQQASLGSRVTNACRRKDLNGNVALQQCVVRAKYLTHSAGANLLDEAIMAKRLANERVLAQCLLCHGKTPLPLTL